MCCTVFACTVVSFCLHPLTDVDRVWSLLDCDNMVCYTDVKYVCSCSWTWSPNFILRVTQRVQRSGAVRCFIFMYAKVSDGINPSVAIFHRWFLHWRSTRSQYLTHPSSLTSYCMHFSSSAFPSPAQLRDATCCVMAKCKNTCPSKFMPWTNFFRTLPALNALEWWLQDCTS